MGAFAVVLQILLLVVGLFLMLIILLQRGRGGGLAGAFGGMGGQSAFGTKAGDLFTWITVGTATVWVLLAGVSGCVMRESADQFAKEFPSASSTITTPEKADAENMPGSNIPVIPPQSDTPASTPAQPEGTPESSTPAAPTTDNAETTPATPATPAPMPETPAPQNGSPEPAPAETPEQQ